jgi:hypothetical protein
MVVGRQRGGGWGGAPVSFSDSGGVLQHGGVEGGEGGRLIEEEEGRRVGSPEDDGTVGVVALQPNSGEGRGLGAQALSGWGHGVKDRGVLGRPEFGAQRKGAMRRPWRHL